MNFFTDKYFSVRVVEEKQTCVALIQIFSLMRSRIEIFYVVLKVTTS